MPWIPWNMGFNYQFMRPAPTIMQSPLANIANLPVFRTDDDYEERLDPNLPSSKKPFKVYRYRPERGKTPQYKGWKHVSLPMHHTSKNTELRIVSWNLDFRGHNANERTTAAMNYLQTSVFGCATPKDRPEPCVIMLQEVHSKALRHSIAKHPWVQKHFMITPVDHCKWPSQWMHGNITLIERSIVVTEVYFLEYGVSDEKCNALALSIKLQSTIQDKTRNVMLINTQLDVSLENMAYSRRQIRECGRALEESDSGGVVVGTMPLTFAYPDDGRTDFVETEEDFLRDLELVDAVRNVGDEKTFTWGLQPGVALRKPICKSRPDRILSHSPSTRRQKLLVDEPQLLGIGLTWNGPGAWVSGHYGLSTTIKVEG